MFAKKDEKTSRHAQLKADFIALAKLSRGNACLDVIRLVTENPVVYTFSELLEMQVFRDLADNPEQKVWLDFLKLFAYGNVKMYKDRASEFPPLSPNQLQKLRHLTIVSLATRSKTITYAELQEALDISNVRELEDLIIDACYAGVIQGKLDQKRKLLEINFAVGRDIEEKDEKKVAATLEKWCDACESLLTALQNQIQVSNEAREAHITHTAVMDSTWAPAVDPLDYDDDDDYYALPDEVEDL